MKKLYFYGLVVFCMLLGLFFIQPALFHGTSSANTPAKADIHAKLQRVTVPFVANQGQTDKQVKFYAATFGGTVFVTGKGELVYSLPAAGGEQTAGAVIREKPLNAKTQVVTGQERAAAVVNYFKGNDKAQWKKNLPTYDVVSLGEVFQGVDIKLRAYGNNVEKLFYVRPQADPAKIAMIVEGAQGLTVNKQGELLVSTGPGTIKFTKPSAYQEINGKRIEVPAAYRLAENSASRIPHSALAYSFTVGPYDRTKELVIDPLLASTYIGGTDLEGSTLNPAFSMSIAVAPNGDIYIAGFTDSTNFPTVFGPKQPASGGLRDAFVSRFDRGLTNLVASTYLGGSGSDSATSLAIDNVGNVYVAGYTNSAIFPLASPFQAAIGGGIDAFVAKLTADLTSLTASTYLGGSGDDHAFALIVDASGVYLGGDTVSPNFPGTAAATFKGLSDGFLAKLGANLGTLTASAYFGGSGSENIHAMAIKSPNIFVAGYTTSTDILMTNPIQNTNAGGTDVFLAKFDNVTLNVVASTYLGGTGEDHAYSIAINPAGDVFVAGDTTSPGIATPAGAYDTTKNLGIDGFVAKLNESLAGLSLTYLGGSGDDHVYSVAINGANLYVAGDTTSTDFPVIAGSYNTAANGNSDTFLSKLNTTLTALSASTYLGGSGDDFANAIALDIFGNVYLTGFTVSTNLPTSATAYQTANVGFSDAFVSKFDANLSTTPVAPPPPDTTAPTAPTNLTAVAASDTTVSLTWTASTDIVGVVGYEVWRGGAKIKTIAADSTTYSDTGLTADTAYTYKVAAFDAANNVSLFSNAATATTLTLGTTDTTPPSKPASLIAEAGSDTQINLTWAASTDDVGVAGYEVWRGNTKIATVTTLFFGDTGLTASTAYTYTIKAFDGANNISAASDPATATTRAAAAAPATDAVGSGGGGGGCFIATAAYGSYMADDVMVLRRFRDDYLLTNAAGRAFVNLYYTWSPPLADFIAGHETLRTATRAALSPLVYGIKYPAAAMLMLLLVFMGGAAAVMRRKRARG